jgi:hypothetical protein
MSRTHTRKSTRRARLAVAVVAVLGVMATASPAHAGSAARCPDGASATCTKPGKQPARAPKQARPKVQPKQVTGPYGGPVFRSGSWLMS